MLSTAHGRFFELAGEKKVILDQVNRVAASQKIKISRLPHSPHWNCPAPLQDRVSGHWPRAVCVPGTLPPPPRGIGT